MTDCCSCTVCSEKEYREIADYEVGTPGRRYEPVSDCNRPSRATACARRLASCMRAARRCRRLLHRRPGPPSPTPQVCCTEFEPAPPENARGPLITCLDRRFRQAPLPSLVVTSTLPGLTPSTKFSACVRCVGGDWESAFVFMTTARSTRIRIGMPTCATAVMLRTVLCSVCRLA